MQVQLVHFCQSHSDIFVRCPQSFVLRSFKTMIKHIVTGCVLLFSVNIAHAAQKIDWQPYTLEHKSESSVKKAQGQLAYFEVPFNRQSKQDKTLKLGFVRLPSTAKNPGSPIVYLSGGPGGSATGTAKGPRFELFVKMREVADVILFDQRGTGLSRNGLRNCRYPAKVKMTEAYTRASLLEEIAASAKYCAQVWQQQGVDLNGYNTLESAADLEDLRKVLGAEKLDLWGISYGTHLAMAAAKYYPNSIGRMVLASSEGLDHTVKLPARSDLHLKRVAKELAASGKPYPDLLKLMTQVHQQLKDKPATIMVKDPRSGNTFEMTVGDIEVQLLTAYIMTKDPENIARLPATYGAMAKGDFSHIGAYLAYIKHNMWQLNPMSMAMDAASGISKTRWQQVLTQSQNSVLWRAHNLPFPDAAKHLGIKDLGDDFRQPLKSDIPTLFLAGNLDGRTFIDSQRELAKGFSNSQFVTIERAGHNLFTSSPRVLEMMMAFYRGKTLKNRTITLAPIPFL